jgi:hypothetical protein
LFSFLFVHGICHEIFLSGFSSNNSSMVPLDILRKNLDFNTITEELFEFNGDSPVYSQEVSTSWCLLHQRVLTPLCVHPRVSTTGTVPSVQYSSLESHKFDSPVCSLPGSQYSPVCSLPGSQDSPCVYYQGVKIPRCLHYKESRLTCVFNTESHIFTVLSCFKGLPQPLKEHSVVLRAYHGLQRNNH